jgi:hypothetical protein
LKQLEHICCTIATNSKRNVPKAPNITGNWVRKLPKSTYFGRLSAIFGGFQPSKIIPLFSAIFSCWRNLLYFLWFFSAEIYFPFGSFCLPRKYFLLACLTSPPSCVVTAS